MSQYRALQATAGSREPPPFARANACTAGRGIRAAAGTMLCQQRVTQRQRSGRSAANHVHADNTQRPEQRCWTLKDAAALWCWPPALLLSRCTTAVMLHRCCHAALLLLRRTHRAAPAATLAHCNREPSLQAWRFAAPPLTCCSACAAETPRCGDWFMLLNGQSQRYAAADAAAQQPHCRRRTSQLCTD